MNLDKLKQLAVLKSLKSAHERKAEIIGAEINALSEQIYDELVDDEIPKVELDGFSDGRTRIFLPYSEPRITVCDEPSYFAWLEGHDYGALIKRTVHHASSERLVKDLRKRNEEPPVGLKIWDQKKIGIKLKPERKG